MAAVDCFRSSPQCFRRLLLLFCFFVGVFHSNVAFAEEDNAEEKSESSQAAPTKKLQKPKKISIDSSRTVQGVFYGYVSFIHPKGISMVVIPQYQEYSRLTFMLDNETIYRCDKTKFSKNPLVPGEKVYTGQVVGEHNRDNDLVVNITRLKQLTNMRAASKEATVVLKQARIMGLEACLEYIEDDELVEITPKFIRIRKRILDESQRKRVERQSRDKDEAKG